MLALIPLLACRHDLEASDTPQHGPLEGDGPAGWHYVVSLESSLERASVRLCFDGRPPARLVPTLEAAAPHTHGMRLSTGDALPREGLGHGLGSASNDACVDYEVDFVGLENDVGTGRTVGRTGQSLMARPTTWLWRPDPLPERFDSTVRFTLPEGMEASVPWVTADGRPRGTADTTYALDRTAFEWLGYGVFGQFAVDRFEHAGASVELVTIDVPIACPPEGLRRWVEDGVETVAMLFDGRFPRPRLQLIVFPVEGGGGSTVYFGMASRGGGSSVLLFVDDEAEADALPGGWTTVHEMLHHGMPFIREAWMAEGWVSYYTEIMRTRAGHRGELEGWQQLVEAFGRGRRVQVDTTLAETSRRMHETRAYQRVYWGGAAVAFMADVELRLRTQGTVGLDDAMRELRRCCGDAPRQWSAGELLEHLDAWHGRPLFTETAQAVLEQRDFPDVETTMARLGVHVGPQGEVTIDDDHPAAEIRRSIMAPVTTRQTTRQTTR